MSDTIVKDEQPKVIATIEIDVSKIPSPVLRRLIEEVRNEEQTGIAANAYNRFHNRHNRSGGHPW